jgi:uncharacterized protein (DUF58 family)
MTNTSNETNLLIKAIMRGNWDQSLAAQITPELLRLSDSFGRTVAHTAAYFGHLNQIDPSLITPELLRLHDDSSITVAHTAARNGHLDQIDPALITPELLELETNDLDPVCRWTVAQLARKKPEQLSKLLSRVSSLTPDVQASYRKVLGENLVPTAGTGHEAPAV